MSLLLAIQLLSKQLCLMFVNNMLYNSCVLLCRINVLSLILIDMLQMFVVIVLCFDWCVVCCWVLQNRASDLNVYVPGVVRGYGLSADCMFKAVSLLNQSNISFVIYILCLNFVGLNYLIICNHFLNDYIMKW